MVASELVNNFLLFEGFLAIAGQNIFCVAKRKVVTARTEYFVPDYYCQLSQNKARRSNVLFYHVSTSRSFVWHCCSMGGWYQCIILLWWQERYHSHRFLSNHIIAMDLGKGVS